MSDITDAAPRWTSTDMPPRRDGVPPPSPDTPIDRGAWRSRDIDMAYRTGYADGYTHALVDHTAAGGIAWDYVLAALAVLLFSAALAVVIVHRGSVWP